MFCTKLIQLSRQARIRSTKRTIHCNNNLKYCNYSSINKQTWKSHNTMYKTNICKQWNNSIIRNFSSSQQHHARRKAYTEKNKTLALYALSAVIGVLGGSYAAVPLYKIFCQATGFGGTVQKADMERAKTLTPVKDGRVLKITFNADTSDVMPWKFRPSQKEVRIVPGETALAFFKAVNKSDKPVTGVATYNVTPMRAGIYFNKIQCFCFEEQRLGPKEEVDMPVFFYVDPEFLDDPLMDGIKTLTLSYTFFKTEHEEEELEQEEGNAKSAMA